MFESLEEQNKRTVQKIILPAFIILLCLISMVGVTWALFTNGDDGKIGVNVASGQVEVGIIDDNGDSLVGRVLEFDLNGDDDKDENHVVYFEPGATIYTQSFRVINTGTVSINFRVYISNDEKENMQAFEDAFELWITKDPNNLNDAKQIKSFVVEDFAPDQVSEKYFLVIRMKESAGNEFQGKEYSGIGITVYAVQGNVEIK